MSETMEQLIEAQTQTITELTDKLKLATETKAYGLTRFLNLSSSSATDIARSLLEKILVDDPNTTRATIKLEGYEVIITKSNAE